jgi:hypothetical protein
MPACRLPLYNGETVPPGRYSVFSTNDPEIFWLTTTNVILGLVVLVCIIIVAYATYQEIRLRITKRSAPPATENRAVVIPLVGPTMADGGEPIGSKPRQPGRPQRPSTDESRTPHTES